MKRKTPLKKKPALSLDNFDYNLPPELIAQSPVRPRDHSRLLVLDKEACDCVAKSDTTISSVKNCTAACPSGKQAFSGRKCITHHKFYNIIDHLNPGDVLVFNNSKVISARLHGQKDTGGKVEVFLLNKIKIKTWHCLIKGKVKPNTKIYFSKKYVAEVLDKNNDGTNIIKFNKKNITSIGQVPTPPYIKKKSSLKEYQTVYAKHEGSVAAPTAGFHFTKALLNKIKSKGVQLEYVTLHVGLGTFAPVKVNDITKHKMHAEFATINKGTARRLVKAKKENRRIIAVGTTAVRTLEFFNCKPGSKWINIFIYPGYKFKAVNAMITNFHLPKSTLLMLISAFADQKLIKKSYQQAIKHNYRFYSFGDAMFIY